MAFSIVFNYVFGRVIGHLRETADRETALPAAEDNAKSLTGDRAGGDENAAGQAYCAADIAGNGNRKILRRAKLAMVLCVIGNLAILGFFKYTDFLIGTVNGLLGGQLSLLWSRTSSETSPTAWTTAAGSARSTPAWTA